MAAPVQFTERECDILQLISAGLTNQEIADRLVLSLGTVKWYNSQIFSKLGVTSRSKAILRASELRLLENSPPTVSTHNAGTPNNLPVQLTRFIGRRRELTDVSGLLSAVRLVTLTGSAGIGKTRLAQEFARSRLDTFPDGAYFVPLASVSDPENLIWSIAESMHFPFRRGINPLDFLLDYLQQRYVLLILDNFEHLLEGADVLPVILNATTNVRILVTSRERLNLYGEVTYAIGGLANSQAEAPSDALETDAAILFLERAKAVLPSLTPSNNDLHCIRRICAMVEAMPLAIELAATWVDTLQLTEIAEEIERSLDILQSERRDTPPSQNSMRAAFDRSWNLLDESQQAAFRRLAVFRGGFSRKTAAAITQISVQNLRELVNKSLLRHDPALGRYEMHELLRYFAQEKLEQSGESAATCDAHATYFANFMNDHWHLTGTKLQRQALVAIEADIENVRAAWNTRLAQKNFRELKKFFHGMWVIYDVRGWYPAGIRLFEQAANVLRGLETDEARAALGWLLAVQGVFRVSSERASRMGYELAQEGVGLLERAGQREDLVIPLISLFVTARQVGEGEVAVRAAQECLAAASESGNLWGVVRAKQLLALKAIEEGDYATAESLAREALDICEEREDRWSESVICIEVMGALNIVRQQYEIADRWLSRGLRAAEAIDFKYAMQMAYFQMGYTAVLRDDFKSAARRWHSALAIGERVMFGMAIVGFFGSASTGDYGL